MRHDATLAVIKLAWPVGWLSSWVVGVNWGMFGSIATLIYTILMIVHLLKNWNDKREPPDGNLP